LNKFINTGGLNNEFGELGEYPIFGAEGTTVEEVVEGYAEGAVMMGYMMIASLKDPWGNFDPNYLPSEIIDISGEYVCTNEATYLDTEGNLLTEFCSPYQEEGREWTFEQHESLLMVTIEEDGEERGFCQVSTAGDNMMSLEWSLLGAPRNGDHAF